MQASTIFSYRFSFPLRPEVGESTANIPYFSINGKEKCIASGRMWASAPTRLVGGAAADDQWPPLLLVIARAVGPWQSASPRRVVLFLTSSVTAVPCHLPLKGKAWGRVTALHFCAGLPGQRTIPYLQIAEHRSIG